MRTLRTVAVVACLSLPACYEFDFPLDPKPIVQVDIRLLGAWRCLEVDEKGSPGDIRIERRTETMTHWTLKGLSGDDPQDKSEYDVHGSTVKGGSLLNVLRRGDDANGKWNLVRYTLVAPDILRLQVVQDEPFEALNTANALRKAIEKRMNDPAIFGDLFVCVRVKPEPAPVAKPSPSPQATP